MESEEQENPSGQQKGISGRGTEGIVRLVRILMNTFGLVANFWMERIERFGSGDKKRSVQAQVPNGVERVLWVSKGPGLERDDDNEGKAGLEDPNPEEDHGWSDELNCDEEEEDVGGLGLFESHRGLEVLELFGPVDGHPDCDDEEGRDETQSSQVPEDRIDPDGL